ncbi:hypothetical protein LTR84_000743 [Exophiala bonariae]|uniref:CorA-like transporter domain-containing protein n=1 Tax=Exophiala bonariae TaxID=1690606 RepID=A0AAV9NT73_9EURO|nr:hypothetical protein LTR84_000743 [Exophiala bonariae]
MKEVRVSFHQGTNVVPTADNIFVELQDFVLREAETLTELQQICSLPSDELNETPSQSLLRFFYGLNSRSELWVTYDMVSFALTYHQVHPWFLDFLFPFGQQIIPRDFRFSSFRRASHQSKTQGVWDVPQLGRSGQGYHICYNMKSVENKSTNPLMPWLLEQIVIYHSYDTLTGQAFWIILKGNDSMRNDLEQSVRRRKQKGEDSYADLIDSFDATIEVHLEVCDWSRRGWRWYINYLETRLDELTEHGVTNDIFAHKDPLRSFPFDIGSDGHLEDPKDLGFSNLQQAQHVEEEANKALLALKSDVTNIIALKTHYLSLRDTQGNDWLPAMRLLRFEAKLVEIVGELDMHQAALEALLRLIAGRKETIFGILEYENMLATRKIAVEAQISAKEMEKLTKETKKETVSMKVVTLVTMFFLPATFISTLMSTDIIRWQPDDDGYFQKYVSWGALRFFLALSLPLTFATFLTWGLVYAFIRFNERNQEMKLKATEGFQGNEEI